MWSKWSPMSLFEAGGKVNHIPTVAKEVYDVTGAGDTVVSLLALSLAAGASLTEAALLANFAASIVVGTAFCDFPHNRAPSSFWFSFLSRKGIKQFCDGGS